MNQTISNRLNVFRYNINNVRRLSVDFLNKFRAIRCGLAARSRLTEGAGRFDRAEKNLTGGAENSILIGVDGDSIHSPIEQGRRNTGQGRPSAILHAGLPLTDRQQALLDRLPGYDSRVIVKKNDVSMKDLSALTARTGVEFAMFTRKQERLIVRGDAARVNITQDDAAVLNAQGYKWSGHTHVGLYDGWELNASDGDLAILSRFDQKESVIYNTMGKYRTFEKIPKGEQRYGKNYS